MDIAYRLKQLLETNQRYTVVLCRVGDENISLEKRVQRAEKAKADIFISIHINAFLKKNKRGTETFYYKKKDKVLAKYIHQALVTSLAFPDLGLKKNNYYVLTKTTIPSVLIEPMFITNPTELAMLTKPTVRQRLVVAIVSGIDRYIALNK